MRSEDRRQEEMPVEGWEEFRVTDRQDQAIRRRFHAVDRQLRRLGVSYAQAAEQLLTLPHREQAEQIDPLEAVQVPTPAAARLDELARQQATQHPVEGDGRISTLHHLLALLMLPRAGAERLLRELGVDYVEVVRRIEQEGARLVEDEDWRPMFGQDLADPEWSLVRIHPGGSGLEPRGVLDRLLGSPAE